MFHKGALTHHHVGKVHGGHHGHHMNVPSAHPVLHYAHKTNTKRRNHKKRWVVLASGVALLLLAISSLLIVHTIQSAVDSNIAVSPPLPESQLAPSTPEQRQANTPPASSESPPPSSAPAQAELPARMQFALPQNGLIDTAYFDHVTFVGDSITQGLEIYASEISNAHYCAYRGIAPKGIYDGSIWTKEDGTQEVPMEVLVAAQPDDVYILIGANSIVGMEDEPFLAYYSEMLDAIRAKLDPRVSLYVQSITPVVQGVDDRFDMERINALNDALANMANDKGLYFINLCEALAGEDGWLKPEYGAADGYHLTADGCDAWVGYLRRHTANNERHDNLYIEE